MKSQEILGYSFKTKLKDGLKKMWDWIKNNQKDQDRLGIVMN